MSAALRTLTRPAPGVERRADRDRLRALEPDEALGRLGLRRARRAGRELHEHLAGDDGRVDGLERPRARGAVVVVAAVLDAVLVGVGGAAGVGVAGGGGVGGHGDAARTAAVALPTASVAVAVAVNVPGAAVGVRDGGAARARCRRRTPTRSRPGWTSCRRPRPRRSAPAHVPAGSENAREARPGGVEGRRSKTPLRGPGTPVSALPSPSAATSPRRTAPLGRPGRRAPRALQAARRRPERCVRGAVPAPPEPHATTGTPEVVIAASGRPRRIAPTSPAAHRRPTARLRRCARPPPSARPAATRATWAPSGPDGDVEAVADDVVRRLRGRSAALCDGAALTIRAPRPPARSALRTRLGRDRDAVAGSASPHTTVYAELGVAGRPRWPVMATGAEEPGTGSSAPQPPAGARAIDTTPEAVEDVAAAGRADADGAAVGREGEAVVARWAAAGAIPTRRCPGGLVFESARRRRARPG